MNSIVKINSEILFIRFVKAIYKSPLTRHVEYLHTFSTSVSETDTLVHVKATIGWPG